eukprot:sb/3479188/
METNQITVGPRFTGPQYTGTPIYREGKFPPIYEINGILARYTGYPDLPGKILSPEDPGKSGSDCSYHKYSHTSSYRATIYQNLNLPCDVTIPPRK